MCDSDDYEELLVEVKTFAQVRNRHFELVDGLNVLLIDRKVEKHEEFPLIIESLKRSGAFMVLHASENYDKFSARLEDLNDDLLVLTSYIVRYLCE